MNPLSVPASEWTVLARAEVEDRGDVYSAYQDDGPAMVSAYPKAVTTARTEDGLVADGRMDAYVTGRSDVKAGDRLQDPDGAVWTVVSALKGCGYCTLEIARLP